MLNYRLTYEKVKALEYRYQAGLLFNVKEYTYEEEAESNC